jgi:exodeoxyribonuclease V gamma subunit
MLLVHKSNRLENLAEALADVLQVPLPSPAMPEWVGVQTQGVGVWLGMEVSRRLGIWSNVYSPYPRAMIEKIFSMVLGGECPDTTLFEPGRLTWSVMGLLPEMIETPEFAPLASYLSGDPRGVKRYQLACRIAEAFDRYAVYRPDMVLAWEAGDLDEEENMAPEHRWQPILWRELVRRLGASHVAAVARKCVEVLGRTDACPDGLPPRISLFGVSTLPPLYVHLLAGLPDCVSVNLFMLSPSREHWAYIRSRREIIRDLMKSGVDADRLDEDIRTEEGNRLLASLGRLGRDFQGVLEGSADYLESGEDLFSEPAAGRLLHMLQSDVLNLRLRCPGGEDKPLPVGADDDSLGIHICHSPMREVQVLRDQLLDAFRKNPDLHPHDVIVMMPDIDTYAPLIEAVFGSGAPGGRIPYTISDRGPAGESPVVQAFMTAIHLAGSRLPAQEMLDLLAMTPVRERFGLGEEEVGTVRRWVLDAGVRWGLDAGHRKEAGQPPYSENTWSFGLSRLFLGMAMPDDDHKLFHATLPYPGIEGTAGEVLGKASEFFHAMFQLTADCREPKPAAEWGRMLTAVLSRFVSRDSQNEHQHRMVRDSLEALLALPEETGFGESIDRDVVVQYLTQQFKQRPSVRGFLSGGVTFCNLLPMRSIPFKVVCLLGMNDADFPRSRIPSGFDLTALRTRAGDRSVRNDDRYLFLEALLSAREKLLVFYVGRSVSDNSVLPPSVVVGELLDSLAEGFYPEGGDHPAGGERLLELFTTKHPLQPFSPLYFDGMAPGRFSYSGQYLAGAEALTGPRRDAPVLLSSDLPIREEEMETVRLADLIRFFRMPGEFLLKQRLGVDLREWVEDIDDREPISLDALDRYGTGEFVLGEKLGGRSSENIYQILKAGGDLPLGTPGRCAFDDLDHEAGLLADDIRSVVGEEEMLPPVSTEVVVGDFRITGTIDRLMPPGRVVHTFGRPGEVRRIDLWITHLFMNVVKTLPCPAVSLLIGRGKKGPERIGFDLLSDAEDLFRDLLEVYRLGLTRPLPLFPVASCAYAKAHIEAGGPPGGKDMASILRGFFSTSPEYPGEGSHPGVRRLFGTRNPLEEVGPTGFADLSVRVFGPMLRAASDGLEITGRKGS